MEGREGGRKEEKKGGRKDSFHPLTLNEQTYDGKCVFLVAQW